LIEATYFPQAVNLAISEINYHPYAPSTQDELALANVDGDDFEFIEVVNIDPGQPVNLAGVRLTGAVEFEFGPLTLQPGARAVVVEDEVAFAARYGSGMTVAGQWSGGLGNGGEELTLVDGLGATLQRIAYGDADPWPRAADGPGATLVLDDPFNVPVEQLGKPYRWRASVERGGSPGEAGAPAVGVVVNEVLAHTDAPQRDAIELFNSTNQPIDIGGWYLSDSASNLLKFRIPDGVVLSPSGYAVFDEDEFNPTPNNPGANHFALNGAEGDQVWLVRADAARTTVVEFVDQVEFGATANGESAGRFPDGARRLTPLLRPTLAAANALPRVGPVVLSEINYHPADPSPAALAIDAALTDNDLEFVEVTNASDDAVDLTAWRLDGEASFDFPPELLGVGETLVIVSFDPQTNAARLAAFRAHYGITDETRLVGPFVGTLNNGYGRIQLQRPDEPPQGAPTVTPRLYEDEAFYDDLAPWPLAADGAGASLQRIAPAAFGNAGESWEAASPTPGSVTWLASTADFDASGRVDGSDFLVWQRNFGMLGSGDVTTGDADRDRNVTGADLAVWAAQLGGLPPDVLGIAVAAVRSDSLPAVPVSTDFDALASAAALAAAAPHDAAFAEFNVRGRPALRRRLGDSPFSSFAEVARFQSTTVDVDDVDAQGADRGDDSETLRPSRTEWAGRESRLVTQNRWQNDPADVADGDVE
ncbi:MAG: lamin tail domain-containing protein, partial [Planctomycetales bacterium]|nr:lamin tail domain-containing protein [Planctomycetales bacterium]